MRRAIGAHLCAIGIVLGADRILDMTRTMTNVGADMVTAIVIDEQTRGPDPAPVRTA